MRQIHIGNGVTFPVHRLADGRSVVITSNHSFKFSDGTEYVPSPAQDKAYLDAIVIEKVQKSVAIPGQRFEATSSKLFISDSSLEALRTLSEAKDVEIILVAFMVVEALNQAEAAGRIVRDDFWKVVAYNSTPETQRAPITEKVVDITNWAY